ncbi:sulfotransferase 1A1-like isoform X2 [Symsagittifera roscoffensis]|uniref:sulfotransferase 1A1-like isoform X2 n=1 Tax=Symsagittifera roscoffensis TaxID=84072 RepID=UPI00307C8EE4
MNRPYKFSIGDVHFVGAYTKETVLAAQNYQGSPDDIYLSTYPRSGTTWVQNFLIGLVYGCDALRDTKNFDEIFPYLEVDLNGVRGYEEAEKSLRRARLLKTHLPPHMAPSQLVFENRKQIIVVRNPKDVALSLFQFYQKQPVLKAALENKDLRAFLDDFLVGNVLYGSWWNWIDAWLRKYC